MAILQPTTTTSSLIARGERRQRQQQQSSISTPPTLLPPTQQMNNIVPCSSETETISSIISTIGTPDSDKTGTATTGDGSTYVGGGNNAVCITNGRGDVNRNTNINSNNTTTTSEMSVATQSLPTFTPIPSNIRRITNPNVDVKQKNNHRNAMIKATSSGVEQSTPTIQGTFSSRSDNRIKYYSGNQCNNYRDSATLLYSIEPSASASQSSLWSSSSASSSSFSLNNDENNDVSIDDNRVASLKEQKKDLLLSMRSTMEVNRVEDDLEELILDIPDTLHPTYRSIPILPRCAIWIGSFILAIATTRIQNESVLYQTITKAATSISYAAIQLQKQNISQLFQLRWWLLLLSTSSFSSLLNSRQHHNILAVGNGSFQLMLVQQYASWLKSVIIKLVSLIGLYRFVILRTVLAIVASSMMYQDLLLPPSRISTNELLLLSPGTTNITNTNMNSSDGSTHHYTLPSKLSKFERVHVRAPSLPARIVTPTTGSSSSKNNFHKGLELNVHLIEYRNHRIYNNNHIHKRNNDDLHSPDHNDNGIAGENNPKNNSTRLHRSLIYCNHGFGASSLSWLPILPALTTSTNTSIGLGHDAVGFGFTDRPTIATTISTTTKNNKNHENTTGDHNDDDCESISSFVSKNDPYNYYKYYTMDASANIGTQLILSRLEQQEQDLLQQELQQKRKDECSNNVSETHRNINNKNNKNNKKQTRSIVLFGHSMGSLTTLRMALQLVQSFRGIAKNDDNSSLNNICNGDCELRIRIVLVAPALGLVPRSSTTITTSTARTTKLTQRNRQYKNSDDRSTSLIWRLSSNAIVERLFRYGLRRIVGMENFWKNGLGIAWGDKRRLKRTDILRYQWPSIGKGWEQGILDFAKAQVLELPVLVEGCDDGVDVPLLEVPLLERTTTTTISDQELLRTVLNTKEVEKVDIIIGGKDRVVPLDTVMKFLKEHDFLVQLRSSNSNHVLTYDNKMSNDSGGTYSNNYDYPDCVSTTSSYRHNHNINNDTIIGVTVMKDSGHNPFEEEIENFLQIVHDILKNEM